MVEYKVKCFVRLSVFLNVFICNFLEFFGIIDCNMLDFILDVF